MNFVRKWTLLIIVAFVTLGATAAYAATTHQVIMWFYTDATYTELAGEIILTCANTVIQDGEITPYSREIERVKCSILFN